MNFISSLYRRNLLFQQLNFKYLLTLYVCSTVWKLECDGKAKKLALTLLFLFIYSLDYILGSIALFAILEDSTLKDQLGTVLSSYTSVILTWSREYISWLLNGIPWGIKLNTPLNQFLGTRYLYILDLWKLFYSEFISLYISMFTKLLLYLLPFGITFPLSALHDFLKFLSLCTICFFIISNRIFLLQVSALTSFGRLFMGKKWNILRKRVDSCDYDMNQLLVGTIIFTILLFLIPTTGMYALVFLGLRIVQFAVQFLIRLCVVLVNWLSVAGSSWLYASLQDEPIIKAKVLIRGFSPTEYCRRKMTSPYQVVDGKWCTLECFRVDEEDITMHWNGKDYTVEEMREIINSTSEETLKEELEKYGPASSSSPAHADDGTIEGRVWNHPMMHWMWQNIVAQKF